MPKYRKKPVVIEAFQYDENNDDATVMLPRWFLDAVLSETVFHDAEGHAWVKTLEGDHRITHGDFIIQGVKGEIYPCKPDIFEMTYELAA